MIFETFSQEQTEALAYEMGLKADKGQVFCLTGELGAGKTAFARGFARGLTVCGDITSPTFSIVNEYEGRLPFYHFDVYRIKSVSEMEDTGYEDYVYGDGVCLIEWAELIEEILPDKRISVKMSKDLGVSESYRKITVEVTG